jgi:hypothetical protein
MSKKWTKNLALVGQVIGMLLGTSQDNFYGLHDIADFAGLLGHGVPFAIIGTVIGFFVDYYSNTKTNEDTHVKCPDCRELVLKDARKCEHCGFIIISR